MRRLSSHTEGIKVITVCEHMTNAATHQIYYGSLTKVLNLFLSYLRCTKEVCLLHLMLLLHYIYLAVAVTSYFSDGGFIKT